MIKNILNNTNKFFYKLKNKFIKEFLNIFKLRPDSFPYITGDGFRKIADHVYDETGKCEPSGIKEGQIVFLKSDMLGEWFKNIHPKIDYRYKLITSNSDYNISESDLKFIDRKIIRWFAINVLVEHPKLTPIPEGLDNYYLSDKGRPGIYNKFKKITTKRKNRIIFGFSIGTNPQGRQPAYDFLIKSRISDKLPWVSDLSKYLKEIIGYKFIAAPDGNGHDDPRRWQALYVGVIPIVKKSVAMDYFKSQGIPFYIINDWNDLDKLNEKNLETIYNETMTNKNDDALFLNYWINKIVQN